MNHLKNFSLRLGIGIIAITTLSAVAPLSAQAAGGMVAAFQATPLFSDLNIAPGFAVTRIVTITNDYPTPQSLYFQSLNASGGSGLGSVLTISVSGNGAPLYSTTTLQDFFAAKPSELETLSAHASTTLSVTVSFPASAGSSYQNGSAGFDLCFGFSGGDVSCDGSSGTNVSPVPSGSLLSSFFAARTTPLTISNEQESVVPPVGGSVTWTTNVPATTMVVYGPASGGPYMLDLSMLHYGYPYASPENAILSTEHTVTLSGLTPGTIYDFRVVSRGASGGAPTISPEYTLSIPRSLVATNFALPHTGGRRNVLGGHLSSTNGTSSNATTSSPAATTTTRTSASNGIAAAVALAGNFPWLTSAFAILLGFFAAWFIWSGRR